MDRDWRINICCGLRSQENSAWKYNLFYLLLSTDNLLIISCSQPYLHRCVCVCVYSCMFHYIAVLIVSLFLVFLKNLIFFVYLWLHWVFSAVCRLSLLVAGRVHFLWYTGLVAPWHVKSSWTRDWSCVLCITGWFLTTGPPGKSRFVFAFCHKRGKGNKTRSWSQNQ